MNAEQVAGTLHLEIVAAARRRNAEHQDIPDPEEFEAFMNVLEALGRVAESAARDGVSADMFARAAKFYSKCVQVAAAPDVPKEGVFGGGT